MTLNDLQSSCSVLSPQRIHGLFATAGFLVSKSDEHVDCSERVSQRPQKVAYGRVSIKHCARAAATSEDNWIISHACMGWRSAWWAVGPNTAPSWRDDVSAQLNGDDLASDSASDHRRHVTHGPQGCYDAVMRLLLLVDRKARTCRHLAAVVVVFVDTCRQGPEINTWRAARCVEGPCPLDDIRRK